MEWISIALGLGEKLAEAGVIKLKRKYKEEHLNYQRKIQEEDDKPAEERDMNEISHLKREQRNLEEHFKDEIKSLI